MYSAQAIAGRYYSTCGYYSKKYAEMDDIASRLEKKITGSSDAFPFKILQDVSKAVCKIEVYHRTERETGTAFLAKFPSANGEVVCGLFTNNHVLSEDDLVDGQTFRIQFDAVPAGDSTNPSHFALTVSTTGKFRFTCPVLDVSFVRFDGDTLHNLFSSGCQFLEITSEGKGADEPIFVFQHPGGKDMLLAHGFLRQYHGTDLFHSANTSFGSSGSPLTLSSGKLIGIHKSRSTPTNNYNIAVAMKPVIKAILHLLGRNSICQKLFCNPTILKVGYMANLCRIGLQRCPRSIALGIVYVSPAQYLMPFHILQRKVPVWFVPTSHGWYWTPTDPFDKANDINWMPVSQLRVVGGDLDGQILSDKDVGIITWLCQHNIACCDDFPSRFNRAHVRRLRHPYCRVTDSEQN